MIRVRAMKEGDGYAVLAIYGEGIATGHATFEHEVPSWERWKEGRAARLVIEENGRVIGFAALSPTSSRQVYSGVADVSIYLAARARGRGLGRQLLEALVETSVKDGFWTLQAGIFPENRASLALHAACGFRVLGKRERIGRMRHGPLAGAWRDVVWMERRVREDDVLSGRKG
ncbi:MAG: N-acetyltransferase family protein [Geminicoccaceae bacterium]